MDFNSEIIKQLKVIKEEFPDRKYDTINFLFGDGFQRSDLKKLSDELKKDNWKDLFTTDLFCVTLAKSM